MKNTERKAAQKLRKGGESLGTIAQRLGVSKGSVSLWVRGISLTKKQRESLNENGFSVDVIEKRRESRIANRKRRHDAIKHTAHNEIKDLSPKDLWMIGIALYWGEGGKTARGMVRIANSDPAIIQIMMRFFREVCEVSEEKFRGHVHTFSHRNAGDAEVYWSGVSGIPVKHFYKTYTKQSSASLKKRDTLPYGTFQIYICDTRLYLRIMGWIDGVKENLVTQRVRKINK